MNEEALQEGGMYEDCMEDREKVREKDLEEVEEVAKTWLEVEEMHETEEEVDEQALHDTEEADSGQKQASAKKRGGEEGSVWSREPSAQQVAQRGREFKKKETLPLGLAAGDKLHYFIISRWARVLCLCSAPVCSLSSSLSSGSLASSHAHKD